MPTEKFKIKGAGPVTDEELVKFVMDHEMLDLAVLEKKGLKAVVGKLPLNVEMLVIQRMLKEKKSQKDIGATLGVTQSHISKRLKLLKLIPALYDKVIAGELKIGTAWELAELPPDKQKKAVDKKISQREAYDLKRAHKLKKVDLSSVPSIELTESEVLASKLEILARDMRGKDQKTLLSAAGVLRRIDKKCPSTNVKINFVKLQ